MLGISCCQSNRSARGPTNSQTRDSTSSPEPIRDRTAGREAPLEARAKGIRRNRPVRGSVQRVSPASPEGGSSRHNIRAATPEKPCMLSVFALEWFIDRGVGETGGWCPARSSSRQPSARLPFVTSRRRRVLRPVSRRFWASGLVCRATLVTAVGRPGGILRFRVAQGCSRMGTTQSRGRIPRTCTHAVKAIYLDLG